MVELPLIQALLSGRSYTGPALMADMDTEHKECLRSVVDHVKSHNGVPRVLEVGSWLGGTTLQLVALFGELAKGIQFSCVDDFHAPHELATAYPKGDDTRVDFYKDAGARRILPDMFRHNLKRSGCDVALFEGDMLDTLASFESGMFDLIVLHGTRALTQFEAVLAECRRLVGHDGVLCGTGLYLHRDEVDIQGCDHAYTYRHACFVLHDEKTQQQYYPEITTVMDRELGELRGHGGFWAEGVILPTEYGDSHTKIRTGGYDIFPYDDGFMVLHDSVARSRVGSERLGARIIPEVLEFAETEDEALERAAVLTELQLRRKGIVLEETEHYYVCKYGKNTYIAQCKINDFPRDFWLFTDKLGDYEVAPTLLKGDSFADLKRKVAEHEAAMDAKSGWRPIVERYNGYYLHAAHENHCVAVDMELTHGRPFVDLIGQEDMAPYVLTAPDMNVLKHRIERLREQEKVSDGCPTGPEEWL